jgi:hypothetical protein
VCAGTRDVLWRWPHCIWWINKVIFFLTSLITLLSDLVVLRGHWCSIITWNVHAPSEEKSDGSKDNFYEELEQVFYHFPKYHMKILLEDLNA